MIAEIMACVNYFVGLVPDVIWSGVIASVLTLSGVLISNRSNTKRLRMQLEHDATEKSRERITSIRREIYLRATDEAHQVMRHFVGLSEIDLAETNTSEALHGFQSILSKMKLVVEPATLTLVNSLDKECSSLLVKLLLKVQPMQDLRTEVFGLDSVLDFIDEHVAKTLAEIKLLTASAEPDGQRLNALMKSHESQLTKMAEHKQSRDAKQEQVDRLSNAYAKTIYSELMPFGRLMEKLSIEMRGELGLSTDAVAYSAEMERLRIEMGTLTEETLDAIHSSTK
ncbi:hypothetical protein [Pseudomonas sp. GL-RE-26]|jgi:hypothetical protein|uniref:hypothetical protein n=1 Tax=Pseudomonas sp. GL-RE-26 TaxID=2832390 RepID=UPI001CBD9BB4|nr:hypothetical protein [Pseudomonas sp. GL-RE-26]